MNFQEAYPDTCSTVAVAARHGDVDTMKSLIKEGRSSDVMDNRGWRSLHEAAFHGHVDCLCILLQQEDAEVDSKTFQMETALYLASKRGNSECVKALLTAGADANAATQEEFTPLWEACECGSLACVELLVKAGAHVNHVIYTHDTPLHAAVKGNHPEMVRYLLEAGADIRKVSDDRLTPLFLAAQFGHLQCLQILLDSAKKKGRVFLKKYVNKAAADKASPLWLASQNGHADCVKLLIQHGANPLQDIQHEGMKIYPLQVAVEYKKTRCAQLLLKHTNPEILRWPLGSYILDDMADVELHPIVSAITHPTERCLRLLIDAGWLANITQVAAQWADLFVFGMQLRPAVLLVKWCQAVVGHNMLQARLWANNEDFGIGHKRYVHTMPLEVFVLLLQTFGDEVYDFIIDLLVRGTCNVCRCPIRAEWIMTLIKNIVGKGFGGCIKFGSVYCSHHLKRQSTYQEAAIGMLLVLCLLPNVYHSDIDEIIDESLYNIRHEVDKAIPDDFPALWNKEAPVLKGAPTSLQHLCRMKIAHSLMVNNAFTRTDISTLNLPVLLKCYLQYEEFGVVGEVMMDSFEAVVAAERKVKKVIANVHLTD